MRLSAITYSENPTESLRWSLDRVTVGPITLFVGRNATGKTRVLNVIASAARLLAGRAKPFGSANFNLEFVEADDECRYTIVCKDGKVLQEEYIKGGRTLLTRTQTAPTKIRAEELDVEMTIAPPEDEVALSSRRDRIQHPFVEPLVQWANNLRHFKFGSSLGQHSVGVLLPVGPPLDPLDSNQVIGSFRAGVDKYGDTYKRGIVDDMKRLQYVLDDLELGVVGITVIGSNIVMEPSPVRWIRATEHGGIGPFDQPNISQGMFRALSLLVQLNYSILEQTSECVLVDDIGEGLDYERSCLLIELLLEKAKKTGFQLIMTTNDRFVMNAVPLKMWTVLRRDGRSVQAHNYENSKELFDEFSFTGLNNFDFFSTDFIGSGGLTSE